MSSATIVTEPSRRVWQLVVAVGFAALLAVGAVWIACNGTSRVDDATVKELHAKIGELAVANDFLSRKLKPWTGG